MSEASPTRIDRLLGGRVLLEQPVRGYRVAVDPVLLAAAAPARPGDVVLDAGAGSGAVSLCLRARVPGLRIVALERDPGLFACLCRNVERNGARAEIEPVQGDLLKPPPTISRQSFSLVLTNPPFLPRGAGTLSPDPQRTGAVVESVDLKSWFDACLRRLAPRGRLVAIHRAGRLDALVAHLAGGCGELRLFPLWPFAHSAEAKRVILSARKGVRGEAHLLRGLVLHRADGRFTEEAEAVLREGLAIAALASPVAPRRATRERG
ncbi:tRNA1(Val) (adenine(37)-N6)-methyltransferase [bacterium HR40]|nr:tRNA1(Val) (adenine(37)-N6)-methyltransferase [bacterium HR40]